MLLFLFLVSLTTSIRLSSTYFLIKFETFQKNFLLWRILRKVISILESFTKDTLIFLQNANFQKLILESLVAWRELWRWWGVAEMLNLL